MYTKHEFMDVARVILRYMYDKGSKIRDIKAAYRVERYMHASAIVDDWLIEFRSENEALLG